MMGITSLPGANGRSWPRHSNVDNWSLACQVVVDLSRAAAIADMRPSRVAVIGSILQVSMYKLSASTSVTDGSYPVLQLLLCHALSPISCVVSPVRAWSMMACTARPPNKPWGIVS